MRTVNIREVRGLLPHLDEVLAREGEILVTRRGDPIARLVPAEAQVKRPSHADLRARMTPSPLGSEILIREDRDSR
jgi:prevent-host-death family protein